ncbi:DUF4307 domain-containing protein [Demequina oxidasica]|uniref:DUF4307 domain-containing protein n=1 Tax=Demequina oxidasica TaxID=676199 RepID=UPI000A070CBA|nr:DUF4307 domain-containing protein [Demequina oxidasica]
MMTSPDSTPQPPRRSGGTARPTMSRKGLIWSGVGVAALIAVTAWFGLSTASDPVRWTDVGFVADAPTEATVTYNVYLYTDASADCTVRALNSSFAEVGVATAHIDRADGVEQQVTTTIVTTEQATTATVNYCEATPE